MNPKEMITLSLPIQGMTCGGCAKNVEQAIMNLPGVSKVDVDLPTRLAHIVYDPKMVDLLKFQQAVHDAGYSIPTREVHLTIQGMSCMSCVAHVESTLGDLPGVLKSSVNLSNGTAQVTFVPGFVTPTEMVRAVQSSGYQAEVIDSNPLESTGENEQQQKDPNHPFNANRIGQLKRHFKRG